VIVAGDLSLDLFRASATYKGAPVRLSPLEFRLLDLLANANGRPFSAGEIGEHLHGSDALDANAIEALVARLRRKIGPQTIETRRGFGYVLAGLAL
jgi:DNA-binding response OmpR family regulator